MQLRLVCWVFITWHLMEYVGSQQQLQHQDQHQQHQHQHQHQHPSRVRRQGRMPPNVSQACQGGCATCSEYNACLTCKPRYFIFLERNGMREIGMCLSSCPPGYFGSRFPEPNRCAKCKADCDACFNSNFCTKCKSGFYLHRGKCLENCPEWLEPNNHTMECNNIVHCKTSEWSEWSPCSKKGKTCGFKRGKETRVREILQPPSTKGNPCPNMSETRKCVVQKKCQNGGQVPPNMSQVCQGGCATCSEYNGCLTCKPRYFIFLERNGMREIGMCLSSCPPGYFGKRFPEPNRCAKCKADCDACFNSNFCTKCKSGFYLHRGKCLENCPEWLEPNNHTMECNDIVHCKTSEWSEWSPCSKKGKTCGFKRGNETRIREILQLPHTKGNPCPHTTETRKCVVKKKKCQREGRISKEKRRKRPKIEESKETGQENRDQEFRRQNREPQANKRMRLKNSRARDKTVETSIHQH